MRKGNADTESGGLKSTRLGFFFFRLFSVVLLLLLAESFPFCENSVEGANNNKRLLGQTYGQGSGPGLGSGLGQYVKNIKRHGQWARAIASRIGLEIG